MMTEDEARKKWCPFSRVMSTGENGPVVINRSFDGSASNRCRCVASACMAWRWQPTHINNPDDPNGDMIWSARTYGFCGLAGDSPPLPVSAPR